MVTEGSEGIGEKNSGGERKKKVEARRRDFEGWYRFGGGSVEAEWQRWELKWRWWEVQLKEGL